MQCALAPVRSSSDAYSAEMQFKEVQTCNVFLMCTPSSVVPFSRLDLQRRVG